MWIRRQKILIFVFSLTVLTALAVPTDVSVIGDDNVVTQKPETVQKTLRLVNVVLRHGARSPQSTYPNDPYRNFSMEPFGWGQLTREGRQSQYEQGGFLRKRYDEFLGNKYSPEIFWLQSTHSDRAKMSALLEAAALWKPNDEQRFLKNLPWQPVVLHYEPADKDNLLLIYKTCPDMPRMREAILKSPEIKALTQEYQQLYEELSNFTGSLVSNPDDVFDIYGTLEAEQLGMNFKLPNWTSKYFPEKMIPLSQLSLKINVYNDSLIRMKTGPLLSKIANSMKDKRDGVLMPRGRKMYMYVGHDWTVSSLLEGMKVWDSQIPGYNTMVMIELHQNENNWNVQIFLRNSTNHDAYPLTIPGCQTACPLDEFFALLKSAIVSEEEWKKECELKDPNYKLGEAPLP